MAHEGWEDTACSLESETLGSASLVPDRDGQAAPDTPPQVASLPARCSALHFLPGANTCKPSAPAFLTPLPVDEIGECSLMRKMASLPQNPAPHDQRPPVSDSVQVGESGWLLLRGLSSTGVQGAESAMWMRVGRGVPSNTGGHEACIL